MSTQSYYKDRLGFDPREALYEGQSQVPVKPSRSHHTSHSQQQQSSSNHYNNGNDLYQSPTKKHKNHQHSPSPQGGYEDALTQFKGTMSIWEYFIENSDRLGMSV
jgi:hypothetical protein